VNIVATRLRTAGITAEDAFPNPVNPLWTPSYASLSGTSMATPHVSGAAALLFSSNPQLSPDHVMDLLTSTATFLPSYQLHEAGYGYMNVLTAYEASRSTTGNMPAFLAGNRQHSEMEVVGFDPNGATPYDEFQSDGLAPVAAGGAQPIDIPFNVPQGSLYVDVKVTWTPQQEDAFDINILDPAGNLKSQSGNSVGEAEYAFLVPETFGTYTLRLVPFAGVAVQYHTSIKVGYGTRPANWPPTSAPAYTLYLGVAGLYKLYGVAGVVTDAFRSGDTGFIVFSVAAADGTPLTGQAANLQAVYTNRNGGVSFLDNAVVARSTAGEYESEFDTGTTGWTAGPITVSFNWKGTGTMRAVPTGFTLNKLATTLQTGAANYVPGQMIAFSGDIAQVTTLATGTVQNAPVAGAVVIVSLRDATGAALSSVQVNADLQGHYAGAFTAPAAARGKTTLVAESHYQDPATALGTAEWYGRAAATLTFPGNLAPTVTLAATPDANRKATGTFLVSIDATVKDADGRNDVTSISLVLLDGKGRVLGRWSKPDFTAQDDQTWHFAKVPRATGQSPWTLTITAQDSAGQTVTASQTIK
jgi:hypothetical protein